MRLLTTVFLSACALPVALSQNAQAIVSGLQAIQGQTQYLDNMVAHFTGTPLLGAVDVVNIQQQSDQVARAIEACIAAARAVPARLSPRDSEAVAAAVLALRPVTEQLLDRLATMKPIFDQAFVGLVSVSKQVQTSLQDQKALVSALGYAIARKLSGAYRAAARELLDEFKDAFDEAISEYVVADHVQLPVIPIPGLIPKREAAEPVASEA
ncbi:uncharacterized protein MYCFIDRAFT_210852 [Pseudocercospora fijiensis CIRAD86]|uniref:Cell wall galactomannoprotein n=1 Tax=Pseudocercospora fijiensis (strain CIRAD86) TaxID=383855 RepID=M3AIC4_PSEFD|nr:uncharacterized protein MYCFIDRAFT_210852 [Pseudocercospora fijiensis CIRAD86]EME84336.1 hypothetical protein MYCFIDRAFT_210852 [Pseudocercospora fijiensis CIRAD86]